MQKVYQRISADFPVILMHRVVVGCLVEDIFAFAMLDIMVLERKENARVSRLWLIF